MQKEDLGTYAVLDLHNPRLPRLLRFQLDIFMLWLALNPGPEPWT